MGDVTLTTMKPRRGADTYQRGVPGFYVVNRQTNIGSGPHASLEEAEAEAERRNAIPPATPGLLIAVEIPNG